MFSFESGEVFLWTTPFTEPLQWLPLWLLQPKNVIFSIITITLGYNQKLWWKYCKYYHPCLYENIHLLSKVRSLGRFLLRSVTIHHNLHSSWNRNVVGSIRHVSCFHWERYDKMIKNVYYVIYINFPIKSTDSCWKLRRGQHETSLEKYIKLRSILKS